MKRLAFLLFLLWAVVAQAATVQVNTSSPRQTMEGIGGNFPQGYAYTTNTATPPAVNLQWVEDWHAHWIVTNLPPKHARVFIHSLLEGAGANDNVDPFVFNWAAFKAGLVTNDTGFGIPEKVLRFTKDMQDRGVPVVWALPKPPNWMTISGSGNPWLVAPSNWNELTEFIAGWLFMAKTNYGINNVQWLSFNEPDADGGDVKFTTAQYIEYVKTNAGPRLAGYGFNVKWMMADSPTPTHWLDYTPTMLADSGLDAFRGPVDFHSWSEFFGEGDTFFTNIAIRASNEGLPVFIEEVGTTANIDTQPERDYLLTTDYAVDLAQITTRCLVHSKASALSYWNGYSGNFFPYFNVTSQVPTKAFFAVKHFNTFLLPGTVIHTTTSSDGNILAVSGTTPGTTPIFSLHVVNVSGSTVSVGFSGLPAGALSWFRTSSSESMANVETITPLSGAFTRGIPARSISTFTSVQAPSTERVFFIDCEGGDDLRAGTTQSTSWKRHPFMRGWAGNSSIYSHQNGDKFIFRGGVHWTNGCFPMVISAGGTDNARDYYGVDFGYFKDVGGNVWTKPVFNAQGFEIDYIGNPAAPGPHLAGDPVFGTKGLNNNNFIVRSGGNNFTIDNFELSGMFWTNLSRFGSTVMINLDTATNVWIQNCLATNWSHATLGDPYCDAQRNSICNPERTTDDLRFVQGSTTDPGNVGCIITNCVMDGRPDVAPIGLFSGTFSYLIPNIFNCRIQFLVNGPLLGRDSHAYGNHIGPTSASADSGITHDNLLEEVAHGTCRVHDNIMTNAGTTGVFVGGYGHGNTNYFYNNIMFNMPVVIPFNVDNNFTGPGGTAFIYNNTLVANGAGQCIRLVARTGPQGQAPQLDLVVIQNNFYVTDAAGDPVFIEFPITVNFITNNFNFKTNHADATLAGYTSAGKFAPPSTNSATVNAGTALPAWLFASGFGNIPRNTSVNGPWDVGAYEFGVNSDPGTNDIPPTIDSLIATNLQHNSALLEFTTSENATNQVIWGPTTDYGFTNQDLSFSSTHFFTISNINPATLFHYRVRAGDASGNQSVYTLDQTFTTAPVFTDLSRVQCEAGGIYHLGITTTGTNTSIFQETTDETSNSTTNTVGRASYALLITTNGDYKITAFAAAPNSSSNSWYVHFGTPPTASIHVWDCNNPETNPPPAGFHEIEVSERGQDGTFDTNFFVPKTNMLATGTNVLFVAGRERGTLWDYFRVDLISAPFMDSEAPIITNVFATDIGPFWARIKWTTHESANSFVDYGVTIFDSTNSNPFFFSLEHDQFLTGLDPLTFYIYQVRSCDPTGNCATNGPFTFSTTAQIPVPRNTGGKVTIRGRAVVR